MRVPKMGAGTVGLNFTAALCCDFCLADWGDLGDPDDPHGGERGGVCRVLDREQAQLVSSRAVNQEVLPRAFVSARLGRCSTSR